MAKIEIKADSVRKSTRLIEKNRMIDERSVKSANTVCFAKKVTKVDPVPELASKPTPMGRRLRNQESSTNGIVPKSEPRGRVLRSKTICHVKVVQNGCVNKIKPEKHMFRNRRQTLYEPSLQMVQTAVIIKSPTQGRLLRSRSQTVGPR